MPARKKKKAKRGGQGAALSRYRNAIKRGTSGVSKRIKAAESKIKKLKAEKARKVKVLRKRLSKKR